MSDKTNQRLLGRMRQTLTEYSYSFAVEVFDKYPQSFKEYASLGRRLLKKDPLLGAWFFSHAPDVIKNVPDSFHDYVRIGLEFNRAKNDDFAYLYFRNAQDVANTMPHVFKQFIHAGARMLKKDESTTWDYFKRTTDLLRKLDPTKTYTEDELLLNSIHDPYSANLVGQLIDRKKYRKEYAQKCQGFY